MTTQPRRRWFRFSLRTLFVMVTVAASGLGWFMWQWRIVRERTDLLNSNTFANVVSLEATEANPPNASAFQAADYEYVRISPFRRLLGDESYIVMELSDHADFQVIGRTERAFPEAKLHLWIGKVSEQFRDSLHKPAALRRPNQGTLFTTGLKD